MTIFGKTFFMTGLRLFFCCLLSGVAFFSCSDNKTNTSTATSPGDNKYAALAIIDPDTSLAGFPELVARRSAISKALSQNLPIILLDSLDANASLAQLIATSNEKFRENLLDPSTHTPRLNEIFQVYRARPQELPAGAGGGNYYRVEMYNYAINLTTIALVNLSTQQVWSVDTYPQTQPDLNKKLEDLAVSIAIHSPDVIKALGYQPGQEDALMGATKTALNKTKCERSMHLCVAPTFVKEDKALWAIVDLTENKLIGIRWTNVGLTGPVERISERKLLFEKIMECNCKQQQSVEKDGWKMNYVLTTSDGLRISEVYYKNKLVIHNAKLVDWHVSYSGTDGFGYSDAVGCPEFSHAAVLAVSEPRISELQESGKSTGFVLEQSFQSEQWPRPCNYNYVQRFEFYHDGRFRFAVGSLGRGCGNDGTYRPVTRIVFAGDRNNFSEWKDAQWQIWTTEQWRLQDPQTNYTPEGYQYLISDQAGNGFFIEPGKGQFKDGRGDNAFMYVTKFHLDKDEGENDLVTIGPCCNTDYRQGPEKFIEPTPEDISQSKIVLWYVAQLKNDDTKGREYCWAESYLANGTYHTRAYPCLSGAMFIPTKKTP